MKKTTARSNVAPVAVAGRTLAVALLALGVATWAGCTRHPGVQITEGSAAAPHLLHAGTDAPDSIFLLPKADPAFVGSWGGELKVDPADARYTTHPAAPTSYYFGERNGTVYLRTAIYGRPNFPVVETHVELLDSRRVRFQIDSRCDTCSPPCREVETTTLKLVGAKAMQAHLVAYSYWQGDGHEQVDYVGELHPLTDAELSAIDNQVRRNHVLLGRINAKQKSGG
jgi:hypothetical protein